MKTDNIIVESPKDMKTEVLKIFSIPLTAGGLKINRRKGEIERERKKERETDRQTDRQTEKRGDRQTRSETKYLNSSKSFSEGSTSL